MDTSPDHRVLIVTDAHLPLDDRPGAEGQIDAFRHLLQAKRHGTAELILLGDIFDFWFEWAHVLPKRAFPILHELQEWVGDGIPVHYFAGNHDFRLNGFLEEEIGLQVHMDGWTTTYDGKKYYFHHGDGMAASDTGYRRLKFLFRSRVTQWLFGTFIHPDLAMWLGRITSDEGRRRHAANTRTIPPTEEYLASASRILKQGYDVVVFGHTHIVSTVQLANGWYHNPGAFLDDHRYSVIEGDLPRSEVWA